MAFLDSVGLAHFKQKLQALFASKEDVKGVVKSVNGAKPDTAGNVQIQTSVDTSSLIPKTGSRGSLAGYETPAIEQDTNLMISGASSDSTFFAVSSILGLIDIRNGDEGTSWTKVVRFGTDLSTREAMPEMAVRLDTKWNWVNGKAPQISSGLLILHWNVNSGLASMVSDAA